METGKNYEVLLKDLGCFNSKLTRFALNSNLKPFRVNAIAIVPEPVRLTALFSVLVIFTKS